VVFNCRQNVLTEQFNYIYINKKQIVLICKKDDIQFSSILQFSFPLPLLLIGGFSAPVLGCAAVFDIEAKQEIEAKISFRLEAKKGTFFHLFRIEAKQQQSEAKTNGK
jgi:hypothetical protein